jgi:hypothetical protein
MKAIKSLDGKIYVEQKGVLIHKLRKVGNNPVALPASCIVFNKEHFQAGDEVIIEIKKA